MNRFMAIVAIFTLLTSAHTGMNTAQALETGTQAPEFTLSDYEGKPVKLADFRGKMVVLEWFNPGCPFVQKHYRAGHMQNLQTKYSSKGVAWLSINSTNTNHKDFLTPAKARDFAKEYKIKSTTLLRDEDGKVGHVYGAKTTPHIFVIDHAGILAYQGAIDDDSDTQSDPAKARNYVQDALEQLLADKPVSVPKTAPYGCSVKYAS